jgi:phage/plasmid-associated DNA primase
VEIFENMVSPFMSYITERCDVAGKTDSDAYWIAKVDLYQDWVEWNKQRGEEPGTLNHFAQMLYRNVPSVKHGKKGSRGKQIPCFISIRLKPGCQSEF